MKRTLLISSLFLASIVLINLGMTNTALAQTEDQDPARTEAETRIDNSMVTMGGLVEALANNLGQLHYLRTLCFNEDDQQWRKTASNMMDIEAPKDSARRRQLVRSFNAGYYEQKERYEDCTNTVAVDVAALAENGRRLSIMLGDPYREQ